MSYVLICEDKLDSQPLRMATREDHLAHVGEHAHLVRLAGPLLSEDGERMIGSLFILDTDDRGQVETFHRGDPYTRAALWQRVAIHRFRQVIPEP